MNTREAIKYIMKYVGEKDLVICSLGRTAEETFSLANKEQVLFLDCMGSVTGVAIGVSLGCPKSTVFAFDTDGSFMYNSSIFHSISTEKNQLTNFVLVIFDNNLLESGGNLPSRCSSLDWSTLAKAWGLSLSVVYTVEELDKISFSVTRSSPLIIIVKINNVNTSNTCNKNIDGIESKYRFKRFICNNIRKGIIKPCVKN